MVHSRQPSTAKVQALDIYGRRLTWWRGKGGGAMRGWPKATAATSRASGGICRRPRHDSQTEAGQKGRNVWLHSLVHNVEHVVGMTKMQLQQGNYGCRGDRRDKQQAQHDGWRHRPGHRIRFWSQDTFMHFIEHLEGKEEVGCVAHRGLGDGLR
jgi:hypothetical protein